MTFPIEDYLTRIGLATEISAQTPVAGHADRAHVIERIARAQYAAIPFENLDIHRGIPVTVAPSQIVADLLGRRRGGICYQLNGLLLLALRALGFDAAAIGARVIVGGRPGPPLGHMAVLVDDAGGRLLVDVGFGGEMVCRTINLDDNAMLDIQAGQGCYRLESTVRQLADFEAMAWWHSTSPQARFTGSLIATLVRDGRRTTLAGSDHPDRYRILRAPAAAGPALADSDASDSDDRTESLLDAASARAVLDADLGVDLGDLPPGDSRVAGVIVADHSGRHGVGNGSPR
ncbi:arylamine N-acetyltransferase [Gordonia sp. ABSL1-1]|uniref:arylamine N-acetyltransferase family protein n=1 Tax=Gordonia sp. ABSL1-1 TaxID=3053923 RepID=UPI002572D00E|nr:arylamine N-acetyltransferase [Gordonia sp. ABSL1-1]MDL9936514.1 arylamine N-acetyltransferase [Gordonia sp. ABSL1-1]